MPTAQTVVDQAFQRCRLLARLVELEYERARAYPTDARYVDLGVLEIGKKQEKVKALVQIEAAFGDLIALVEHLTILDMAAAFERLFATRVATAVGAARKTLKERHRYLTLASREKLVRETKDFEGLNDIATLIEADLSQEVKELLKIIRENRNKFSHGTDIQNPPTILKEDARAALNEAIALLQPV